MLDINERIQVISDLVAQGTLESVTYAALECRLAIEYLCYDRLRIAFDYVSHADLKAWQPSKVVKAVEELANEVAATSLTISIAKEPPRPPEQPLTLEERKNLNYHLIGTQSAIALRKITALWNGLSNAALHVHLPKTKADQISIYGEAAKITAKIEECLTEFRSIATGTLLSTGWGREVSIKCFGCEYPVKRKVELLTDGQVVSCINHVCDDSYVIEKSGDEITFIRRVETMECKKCQEPIDFPTRKAEKMRIADLVDVWCSGCGARHIIKTQLVYALVEESK